MKHEYKKRPSDEDEEFDFVDQDKELADDLLEKIQAEERKLGILNQEKFAAMNTVNEIMKVLCKETGNTVSCTLHEPVRSMGDIAVEGDLVAFSSSIWFRRACEIADYLDVYALANGKVRLVFGFHDLVKPIQ